jgi:putative Holliday junction resolvase
MKTWLGLDYGLRRIGIAAGSGSLALAVATHQEGRDGSVFAFLRALIEEREAAGFVVGLPLTADGREAAMAARVRKFAGRLEEEFGLPVIMWDERFSSAEADRGLAEAARPPRDARDAEAARIILQSWLDSRPKDNPGALPGEDLQ